MSIRKSVDAALIRDRLASPRRGDEATLQQIRSEADYCERKGICSKAEADEWRDEVDQRLRRRGRS